MRTLILTSIVILLGCSTQQSVSPLPEPYRVVAAERLGPRVEFIRNVSQSHVLCIARETIRQEKVTRFYVYDLTRDTVVFEDQLEAGSVGWASNTEIRAEFVTGMPEAGDLHRKSYIYDVRTGQKATTANLKKE